MAEYSVTFHPQNRTVRVEAGTTLLEAASKANIVLNNLCGGDGICGRCKMILKKGEVAGEVSVKLTREEIKQGYVLACQTAVRDNLEVEIPEETLSREEVIPKEDSERFRDFDRELIYKRGLVPSPLVTKLYMELDKPSLANNTADHQRIVEAVRRKLDYYPLQTGLKIVRSLYRIVREHDYKVTITVGQRSEIAEVMNVEGGNTADRNYIVVVDMGTTTVVTHLMDANTIKTVDAKACFNSGGIYGREVTGRMMAAEKKGIEELQKLLVGDINRLIHNLAEDNEVSLKDITAVVCAGNTAMSHFLLGLPTAGIRRSPYVATSVAPSPLRAAEVGIEINPRGLLYSLPGISGWVGSDITAGILATELHEKEEVSLLMDIGTNGEIVIGNREWLVATSASAGPALEGAGGECGMRAEKGAIEKVFEVRDGIGYETIGSVPPKGICGSGIIDLVSILLKKGIIDRNGAIAGNGNGHVEKHRGLKRYVLTDGHGGRDEKRIFITESDIENVITAKAAIFAAMYLLLRRLSLSFSDIRHFYVAGAFGNYLNVESAINIGLIPDVERNRIEFVGNTSIKGAKIVTFFKEALNTVEKIRRDTTYYDLMGANDYVEEFQKALFLPHTDIELFRRTETNAV
jgi:uncharacterized 2Fe-2S/4Fe-4S cluster protein (DUF4445 family)